MEKNPKYDVASTKCNVMLNVYLLIYPIFRKSLDKGREWYL
jgi:hypothetical protein